MLAVLAVLATVVTALAGCAPHPAPTSAAASPRSTSSASPGATPTPTPAALPADVLFRISSVATAPNGATARLVETVHLPVATTDTQATDELQLDAQCDSWRTAYTSTKFLVANVVTTVTSGTWDSSNVVATDMASYPVWTGDQRPYQGFCANALPSIPGASRAVSPVGGGPSDSAGGWAIYRYGFSVPNDPSAGQTPNASDVVLSACTVQLGSAARGSIFASTWPGSIETDSGLSCLVGGTQ